MKKPKLIPMPRVRVVKNVGDNGMCHGVEIAGVILGHFRPNQLPLAMRQVRKVRLALRRKPK